MFVPDHDYMVRIRRQIHRHPELSFDLPETLATVRKELDALGISYTEKYGRSCIVADLNPGKEGKTIAVRADMDALPIQEDTGLPYASEHPGKMHACGHDMHTAALLGTAKMLLEHKDELPCHVLLFFEASEELGPSGAALMCRDGVMDNVDETVAWHVAGVRPLGQLTVSHDVSHAESFGVKLYFRSGIGLAGEGADCAEAIELAAKGYLRILDFAEKYKGDENARVRFGVIQGGTAGNVTCRECMVYGSVRSRREGEAEEILNAITSMCREVCESRGGSLYFTTTHYPLGKNDPELAGTVERIARELYGDDCVAPYKPGLGAESFSFFRQLKPGVMFSVGAWDGVSPKYNGHTPKFCPDERVMDLIPPIFAEFIMRRGKVK